jgi:hypothetical protein
LGIDELSPKEIASGLEQFEADASLAIQLHVAACRQG